MKSLAADPWAGQPGAPGARDRRRACSTASGSRARASPAWLRRRAARRCWPPGRRVVASASGAARSRTTRRAAATARRRARRASSPSRSTCRCPNLEDRRPHVRPRRPSHRRPRWRADRGVRPAPVGQAQPQRRPTSPRSPRPPPGRRRRGRHAGQHRPGHGHRRRDPAPRARRRRRRAVGPGHPPGRGAGGPRRARRASPTCPSSASAGWPTGVDAVELLLAGASAVQVGTATFADPRGARAGCATRSRTWCRPPRCAARCAS